MNSAMNKKITLSCYHCSGEIAPDELIESELNGISRPFCCTGCMAIAQTIHGEGLEVFYTRRAQAGEKPAAYLALNEIPDKLKGEGVLAPARS